MSSDQRQVTVEDEPIEYGVRQSGDATEPRIDVGIHEITVIVPEDMDIDPEQLLVENGPWVVSKKRKFEQYRESAPDREFVAGEEFPYLGEDYELVVERRPKADIIDGTIRIRRSAVDQSSVKLALENFYRREAREYLTERADHYANEMGVEYREIEIRNQRTKWGSCSTSGSLGFNWRLMMAPPEIADYVVIHELAHLREGNHTQAFWSLVSEHDADYQEHATWLDENSTRLIFSDDDL
jgi:predicted metal-dependent hydrolase